MTIKKISALLILSVLPLGVLTAQDDPKKDYLPKAGDWAIGIDMQPVYEFFGNMFYTGQGAAGVTDRNTLGSFGGEETFGLNAITHTIMGKLMLDKTTALRLNLGIGKEVNDNFKYIQDDKERFLNPLSEADVIDHQKKNAAVYSLAAGIEFRKGKDRIQGYVGADLLLATSRSKYTYTWGNAITEINQTPNHENFTWGVLGGAVVNYNPGYSGYLGGTERILEHEEKSIYGGVAGRVGVEYFVAPKISLGGEVSLAAYEKIDLMRYAKVEGFNNANGQVEEFIELDAPTNRTFYLKTDDLGGKLFLLFYF